ncbi:MAG TPA: MBL fold metallo-hydrolase [Candidatus Paceibacterota bacterium]
MILSILKYFGFFIVVVIIVCVVLDAHFKSPGWRGPVTDHFDGEKFLNIGEPPVSDEEDRGRFAIIKWLISREPNEWQKREVATTTPAERVAGSKIVATYINHASVLIQTQGLNIVTDPMYGERASPVSWTGPSRYAQPGVAWDDLPPIDIVLVSHNHYDHMDVGTLKRLQERDNPVILAGLGNKEFLKKRGIESAELDWWNAYALSNGVAVTFVPAQHFSARSLSDRNTSLWGGYVISAPEGDIYFAGDTGYGPFVDRIAQNYPKGFRLALLPIGAYKPSWIMSDVHTGPAEMLRMADELSVQNVMPIHFGTFKLAGDMQDEPINELKSLQASSTDPLVAGFNGSVIEIK